MLSYISNAGLCESHDLNRIKGYSTYDTRQYGIFNMGDNVEEWLMDKYTPTVKHYPNVESIYAWNGFKVGADSDFRTENGWLGEKDSTGRMPYLIMGFRNNGEALKITRYKVNYGPVKIRNPDSLKIRIAQEKMIDEQVREIENDPSMVYGQNYYRRTLNPFSIYAFRDRKPKNLEYYRIEKVKSKDGKIRDTLILDRNLILNSSKFVEERAYKIIYKYYRPDPNDPAVGDRVVKTGTWKNPSKTARKKMKETDASTDVGFRTVIQYYGMPVDRNKMVRWR
jgi:hypothetical protein